MNIDDIEESFDYFPFDDILLRTIIRKCSIMIVENVFKKLKRNKCSDIHHIQLNILIPANEFTRFGFNYSKSSKFQNIWLSCTLNVCALYIHMSLMRWCLLCVRKSSNWAYHQFTVEKIIGCIYNILHFFQRIS